MLCGILIGNHPSSNVTSPSGMAAMVDTMMPMKSDPFTLRAMRTPDRTIANKPNIIVGVKLPKPTSVPSWATMMPAFFSPMKAMNIPIPTDMAYLRFNGMAYSIFSRILKNVIIINIKPSIRSMASACCQL